MRILVAMANLRATGGLTMGLGLLEGLRELVDGGSDEYIVLHPTGSGYEALSLPASIEMIPVSSAGGIANHKFRLEQLTVPRLIRSRRVDVLLTYNSLGCWRPPCAHVVFVHLPYLAYGWGELDFVKSFYVQLYYRLYNIYFRRMRNRIDHVAVQTHVMKRRMEQRWGFPEARAHVVQPGVREFAETTETLPPLLRERRRDRPLLSYVSGSMPHKNFGVLPDTLAELRTRGFDSDLLLTLARERPEARPLIARAEQLGVADRLLFVGNVDHAQVAAIYRASFCMVMPSLLETFGLPYIEAMQCGCPVVAADRDFARDSCGDGALYFDPHDAASIAEAVVRLRSDDVRAGLRDAAASQLATHFAGRGWTEMARDFRELCREAAAD